MKRVALASVAALLASAATLDAQPPVTRIVVTHVISSTTPDTATAAFYVDGIHVIVRRNPANEVVAANVYLLGGAQELTPATQGIESFLLAAAERGTARYPGASSREKLARLGSSVSISPGNDFTVFGLRTTLPQLDSSWAIFADRLVAPTLAPAEVERVRAQLLSALSQQRTDPDDEVHALADSLVYAGHPYALHPEGTLGSVRRLTTADLRAWQRDHLVQSRMLVVVVGDVDEGQITRLVRSTLGRLPRGTYQWHVPPELHPLPGDAVEQRALPTNYLLAYAVGPRAGTREYTALRLASAVLAGRFFTDIRSERNLSYAVDAPFVEQEIALGGLYVTTTDPDAVLRLMRAELVQLQSEPIEQASLDRLVQGFITDYFLKNETNADQATFLARAELYEGDYRAPERFVEDLHRISPDEIRRAAAKYLRDFRFAYLGDPSKVDPALLSAF